MAESMSLRDWFAGQALAGMLACDDLTTSDANALARWAYQYADAMIAARETKPSP